MNMLRDYTFKWWQVSLLKVCMVSFGIVLGAVYPGVFSGWIEVLEVIFIASAIYFIYAMFARKI